MILCKSKEERLIDILQLENEELRRNTEQRADALEATSDDIILMMAELIGGNEA